MIFSASSIAELAIYSCEFMQSLEIHIMCVFYRVDEHGNLELVTFFNGVWLGNVYISKKRAHIDANQHRYLLYNENVWHGC